MSYTLRVACEPGDLAAIIEAIKALGHPVECPAHDARERLRARDGFLVQALELMSGTLWARCTALAAEVQRFEAIIWPRIRDHEVPPEGSKLRSLLFRARRLGPLPGTARQIRNIIAKRGSRGDFTETPL
jgi:hypothetical protein